jgi:hypothetical protein
MNVYDKRWNHAFNWAKKLKSLFDTGKYLLVNEDDEVYSPHDCSIFIDEESRLIKIKENHCSWTLYDGRLEYDHGAYTPIKEFKKTIIDSYRLYKLEPIKL